ncbi:MAG: hypothetical protein ACXAC2_02000 [Candidatus Kariarchaeaceae archaeon]
MAILKSINENHDNLPDDIFWNRKKWDESKQNPPESWYFHTRNIMIRHIKQIDTIEDLISCLEEEIINEKDVFHLNLVGTSNLSQDDWNNTISEYYMEKINSNTFELDKIQYFNLDNSNGVIQPFTQKVKLVRRIFGSKISKIQGQVNYLNTQLFTIQNRFAPKPRDTLLKQAGEKNVEKYNRWISRLEKADHDMSNIVEMGHARVRRNHYSVNSNFNKSGKLIITDKNTILIRRKFGIFGFSLFTLLPLLAFVRPANKLILVIRIFMQFVRIPLQILKGLRPLISAALPAIGGIIISTSLLNFDDITSALDPFEDVPILSPISFGINFFAENPEAIPVAIGLFTGLRLIIPRLLKRSEEIVILPHENCNMLIANGSELIGRWSVKGSDLVKASKGIQYRFLISDHTSRRDRLAGQKLTMNIFNTIMGDIPSEIPSDPDEVSLTEGIDENVIVNE